jgi:hypothetical protein
MSYDQEVIDLVNQVRQVLDTASCNNAAATALGVFIGVQCAQGGADTDDAITWLGKVASYAADCYHDGTIVNLQSN